MLRIGLERTPRKTNECRVKTGDFSEAKACAITGYYGCAKTDTDSPQRGPRPALQCAIRQTGSSSFPLPWINKLCSCASFVQALGRSSWRFPGACWKLTKRPPKLPPQIRILLRNPRQKHPHIANHLQSHTIDPQHDKLLPLRLWERSLPPERRRSGSRLRSTGAKRRPDLEAVR